MGAGDWSTEWTELVSEGSNVEHVVVGTMVDHHGGFVAVVHNVC